MKTVCNKNQCTSCTACINVCPLNCITLINTPTCTNAVINENTCINCKQCYSVCQQVKFQQHKRKNDTIFIGYVKDNNFLSKSSSGGIAAIIALSFIKNGWFVCGSIFRNGSFIHYLTNKEEDLDLFRGSKYVKSSLGNIFKAIKNIISKTKVLFIGTPCQVYGLQQYLSKFNLLKNLYTIDLICHGTPQQMVLEKFLKEQYNNQKINSIQFREGFSKSLIINGDKKFSRIIDPYSLAFQFGLIFTDNCYSCKFSNLYRVGDISLGDAIGETSSSKSSNKLSLILPNTIRGEELLKIIDNFIYISVGNSKELVANNHSLNKPFLKPLKDRNYFFNNFNKKKFKQLIRHIYPKAYYRQMIKKINLWLKDKFSKHN